MNKSYRLLWTDITRTWVAVSEVAKASGKRQAGRKTRCPGRDAREAKGVFNGRTGKKKSQPDKGWEFEYWWWNTEPNPRPLSEADSNRTRKCPCFRAIVLFPSRALSTEGRSQFGLASEEAVAKSKPSSIPHFAI